MTRSEQESFNKDTIVLHQSLSLEVEGVYTIADLDDPDIDGKLMGMK